MKTEFNRPTICDNRDLERYGVGIITGERCAYSLRLACDLNEAGRELLKNYLGVPDLSLSRYLNPEVDGKPAVGCIMLPSEILIPLCIFILFDVENCEFVAYAKTGFDLHGFMFGDTDDGKDLAAIYSRIGFHVRTNVKGMGGQPYRGSLNVHAIMG